MEMKKMVLSALCVFVASSAWADITELRKEVCKDIDNSYKCHIAIEKRQIKKYSRFVKRKKDALVLTLKSGRTANIVDIKGKKEDQAVKFNFLDHLKDVGYYLLAAQLYKGGDYYLVSMASGKVYSIGSVPVFSPDKKWCLTATEDLNGAKYAEVKIWRVSRARLGAEWTVSQPWKDSPKAWAPWKVSWKDSETVVIDRIRRRADAVTNEDVEGFGQMVVKLSSGKWEVAEESVPEPAAETSPTK